MNEKNSDNSTTCVAEKGTYRSGEGVDKAVFVKSGQTRTEAYKPYDSLKGRIISLKNFKKE